MEILKMKSEISEAKISWVRLRTGTTLRMNSQWTWKNNQIIQNGMQIKMILKTINTVTYMTPQNDVTYLCNYSTKRGQTKKKQVSFECYWIYKTTDKKNVVSPW